MQTIAFILFYFFVEVSYASLSQWAVANIQTNQSEF